MGVKKFSVKMNLFDRIVNSISPERGLSRLRARASLNYLEDSGYVVPGSNRKSVRTWHPTSDTADRDSIPKLDDIRRGCRDLAMNSPIANAPLNREVTNAVGWGLIMQSRIDREMLGMSDNEAESWERNTEREFNTWAKSKDCDAARTLNFYTMQGHVMYNTSLSGDIFALLPYIKRPGKVYDLTVSIIEADMVSTPPSIIDNNKIAGGVEVDDYGAPVKYYFKRLRMDNATLGSTTFDQFVLIPAFGAESGRRNVLHLYHKLRPGQRRGIPMLAPVIDAVKQLSRLTEAELAASVINSFFTVFIKTNPVTGGLADGYIPEDAEVDATEDPRDEYHYELGSGSVVELGKDGQEIQLADPKRPNENFESFYFGICKMIGAATNIPFEQLILHFQSSYSAARAALLEAWKFYRIQRVWLATEFCQPVYEEWLTEAVLRGRIVAPGFFEDPSIRAAWCGTTWTGPGQGQIDPLKESKAIQIMLSDKTPLSDFETEHARIYGTDWEDSMTRLSRQKKFLKAHKIIPEQPATVSQTASNLNEDQLQELEDNTPEQ
jgi:lambda family phage portal protein